MMGKCELAVIRGILTIIFTVLIVLKLTLLKEMSWWIVFSPALLPLTFAGIALLAYLAFLFFEESE